MRILLIEDDPSLGSSLQAWLQLDGYAVDWLQRGDQAAAALATHAYQCVLLDRGLPGLDGDGVLRALPPSTAPPSISKTVSMARASVSCWISPKTEGIRLPSDSRRPISSFRDWRNSINRYRRSTMRHPTILAAAALLTLGATTAAIAQSTGYTGPSSTQTAPGAYTGPSSVPLMTVQQLLDTGNDDQHARLQGRIVSHDGGDHYTFEDATGKITIEIDDEDFPTGQSIAADTQVELLGEFDKGLRKTEFEVDRVTLFP